MASLCLRETLKTLQQTEEPGTEPLTLWLVDNPLCLLSYSHWCWCWYLTHCKYAVTMWVLLFASCRLYHILLHSLYNIHVIKRGDRDVLYPMYTWKLIKREAQINTWTKYKEKTEPRQSWSCNSSKLHCWIHREKKIKIKKITPMCELSIMMHSLGITSLYTRHYNPTADGSFIETGNWFGTNPCANTGKCMRRDWHQSFWDFAHRWLWSTRVGLNT